MADILIRGMDMPHSCMCCPLNHGEKRPEYGWTIVCMYSNGVVSPELTDYITRLPTCGISELPAHGDLIDRNKLIDAMILLAKHENDWRRSVIIGVMDAIGQAPVISPASKEEAE